jgi:hypothetical protein
MPASSFAGLWVALLIPTTSVASRTHSVTVATTSQTHPSQIEIPSRIDQVILFIAARPRIFALFDRSQPFQKLALSLPSFKMAPKIDPNEIKVGIHVIGGTTEESGFGIEVRGDEGWKVDGDDISLSLWAGRSWRWS